MGGWGLCCDIVFICIELFIRSACTTTENIENIAGKVLTCCILFFSFNFFNRKIKILGNHFGKFSLSVPVSS